MGRVTRTTQQVDPARAEQWLTHNVSNRRPRPAQVKKLAEAMAAGGWLNTEDPIKFDEDGNLIDGQHRLRAVVRSGCTVEMTVVRGLSRHVQDLVDIGSTRTAADALQVRGFSHGAALAGTVPIVNWLLEGGGWAAGYTRDEVVAWVEHHEGLAEVVEEATANRNLLPCQLAPYAASRYAALFRTTDREATDRFFVEELVHTIGLVSGSPALATRQYLLSHREDRKGSAKEVKAETVLALLAGYAAFREDKKIARLRAPFGGWPVDEVPVIPT